MAYQCSILVTKHHRYCSILHLIQAKKASSSPQTWHAIVVDTASFMSLPLHSQELDSLTYESLPTFLL